jgi:hypothetical protein
MSLEEFCIEVGLESCVLLSPSDKKPRTYWSKHQQDQLHQIHLSIMQLPFFIVFQQSLNPKVNCRVRKIQQFAPYLEPDESSAYPPKLFSQYPFQH